MLKRMMENKSDEPTEPITFDSWASFTEAVRAVITELEAERAEAAAQRRHLVYGPAPTHRVTAGVKR